MKIPKIKTIGMPALSCKADGLSSDFAKLVSDSMKNFMYEPMNETTVERIKRYIQDSVQGPCSVDVDFMHDLAGKEEECWECSKAGSYEEYKLKCVAFNKPDVAGSEREWRRMAMYRPGQCTVNTTFCIPGQVEVVEYTAKLI